MQGFNFIFFAIVAMLTAGVIAEKTRFNIASKYKVTKNGKPEEQRNTINYEKEGIVNIDNYVKNFNSWSGGAFNCKKSAATGIYIVTATKVYDNKDKSTAANNDAKKVINDHASDK
ncbi:uncharacterized protein PG998_013246 [Apiospora kogelbergensis]|uniref:Uncharacterized protein n=1 Tax=Apiospora kogelbergensis TaxID=1337665 RepID=A0AAW0R1U5_9PEZI